MKRKDLRYQLSAVNQMIEPICDPDWSTVISPPRLPRLRIDRPRLIGLLDALVCHSIVTLSSPAGFSKTMSVQLWLESKSKRASWFNARPSVDNLNVLQRWLQQYKQVPCLVIDDAHNLCEHCWRLLTHFVSQMPEHHQLFILSRQPVFLDSPLLKAEGRLASVGIQELSFDRDECLNLLKCWKIDDTVCQLIPDYITGWPAAIQLWASVALRFNSAIVEHSQWQIDLHRYMEREWLSTLTSSQREVLIYMALGEGSATGLLKEADYLNAMGQFIEQGIIQVSNDAQNPYSLVPMLAEIVKRLPHDLLLSFQKNLGWLLLKNNQYATALHHFVVAKQGDECLAILKQNAWLLFQQGQLHLLANAFDVVEKQKLFDNPSLCYLRAELLLHRDEAKLADLWINDCEQYWCRHERLDEDKLLAIDAYKATIAVVFEDYSAAVHWGNSAICLYNGRLHWEYGKALVSMAEACFYQGNVLLAERYARLADALAISNHHLPILASARYWIAQVLWHNGEYQDALTLLQYTAQELRSNRFLAEWRLDFIYRLAASMARQLGDTALAHELYQRYGKSAVEDNSFRALPWLTEKLMLSLSEQDINIENIQSLVKTIECHLAQYRVCLVWRLNADQACILAWTLLQERQKLKLRARRTLWDEQASNVLYAQESYSIAIAWLALAEPERARAKLESCYHKAESRHISLYQQLTSCLLNNGRPLPNNEIVKYWRSLLLACIPGELLCVAISSPEEITQNSEMLIRFKQLTPTETRVLERFTWEGSNERMARELGMAVSTLRSHIKSINKKLGCSKRSELRALAVSRAPNRGH